MVTSFGRTAVKVLPILAVLALGATTAFANPLVRPGAGSPAVRPGTHGPWLPNRPHVKRNAGPGPVYYAGGATLPAVAYYGAAQATAGLSTSANPGIAPGVGTTGTVFGYFASTWSPNHGADTVSYCQTGSGFGKKVFDGFNQNGSGLDADLPCAPLGTSPQNMINGFSAPPGQGFADFDGSDAPLSASEFGTYVTNASTPGSVIFGRGVPVQVPFIVGAVAILYNNPDISNQINLTPKQVCQIAGGYITNWSQLGFPSRPLGFAFRSDGSGTSFSFSNHLNTTCKRYVTPNNFSVSQNFSEYVNGNPPVGVLPNPLNPGEDISLMLPASGNPGVVQTIVTTPGAIGYVEAANALSARNGSSVNFAKIAGKDPIKNLPAAAGVISGAFLKSMAVGSDVQNGRASLVSLSPTDNCVLLVNPLAYANPSAGYSIIAVSNLEFATVGNGADASDLQALAKILISKTPEAVGPGKITSVDRYGASGVGTTGYSTLNQKRYQTVIKTTASTCIGA